MDVHKHREQRLFRGGGGGGGGSGSGGIAKRMLEGGDGSPSVQNQAVFGPLGQILLWAGLLLLLLLLLLMLLLLLLVLGAAATRANRGGRALVEGVRGFVVGWERLARPAAASKRTTDAAPARIGSVPVDLAVCSAW
jgi:hypothetical protein